MSPKEHFLLHHFFKATIIMITAMTSTSNPESGRIISLSFVSGVVAYNVLLTDVDCVVSDRTVALLKNYKAES